MADAVPVPVIAAGGAGQVDHILDVILEGGANAVCLASILHYGQARRESGRDDYADEGNVEYLRAGAGIQKRMQSITIPEMKLWLAERGVACRLEAAANA